MPVERSKDHIARVGELSDPLEGSSAKGHQNGFEGCASAWFRSISQPSCCRTAAPSSYVITVVPLRQSCNKSADSSDSSHLLSGLAWALPINKASNRSLA